MATILSHIRVHPGREAEFERAAAELWRQTHANEPGARRYEYWRGEEAGTYYALLSFADFHEFINHQTSDHHEEVGALFKDLIAENRLEWVDPLASASDLAPTERADPKPGASDLARKYHERYEAQVQDWWQPLRDRPQP